MLLRSHRPAALFAAVLLLACPVVSGGALAQAPASPREAQESKQAQVPKPAKEPSVGQSAARERQKKCGAEWRALSVSDKAAQGPKWPQYYSKCVKRLKRV